MFTYGMLCILILAFFSCDAGDPLPTSNVIKLLEEFNITDNATAQPVTVYGRSISRQHIKFGVYPQHVTWFDANATCIAEGYGSLVTGNNNIRKSMAFNSMLLTQENFINFDYWSGYVRLDPCNATWSKSNCDPVRNRGIISKIVTANQKQCATLKYNGTKVLGEHTGRFCSELHPFMCKIDLGSDDMFTKLNDSLVPTSRSDLLSSTLNVSFSESTGVPECMARCRRDQHCTAFTFSYDKNRCWLQTSEVPEVLYELFQVSVNVSSYVKDGYQYDIHGNSTIQNVSQVFSCLNGSIYNYTRTPYDMNCSESTENGIPVGSGVVTVFPGLYSSQTSTKLSSSSSQTSQYHYISFPTSSNSGMTSASNPSTTSTRPSSILQTQGTFSTPQQSATSLTSPVPQTLCKCPCSSFYEIQNLNQAAASTDIEEVIRKSEIPKRKTRKFQRKLQSATDDRPSSIQIGAVSIAVIACVFGSVIVIDILKLFKHFFWLQMKR